MAPSSSSHGDSPRIDFTVAIHSERSVTEAQSPSALNIRRVLSTYGYQPNYQQQLWLRWCATAVRKRALEETERDLLLRGNANTGTASALIGFKMSGAALTFLCSFQASRMTRSDGAGGSLPAGRRPRRWSSAEGPFFAFVPLGRLKTRGENRKCFQSDDTITFTCDVFILRNYFHVRTLRIVAHVTFALVDNNQDRSSVSGEQQPVYR
ncbi:hypothetical protein JOB18_040912 [Solea senegalensis]|uniref:Uncharacterized protein n=1 Tax=Solea senegalensis TaxID=28829 RepID=A0AAV6QZU6_SOLSE|nr:hypothetical protein JOB18_040912 [Solea senegalensis]